jgi:murein DD-endopeptidase MepM/ murein hydrolase activator NlpD
MVVALCITTGLILGMRSHDLSESSYIANAALAHVPAPVPDNHIDTFTPALESQLSIDDVYTSFADDDILFDEENSLAVDDAVNTVIPDNWESLKVRSGDNLSLIFDRMRISPTILQEIMSLGQDVAILKRLMPDHELRFQLENGELEAMQYDVSLTDTLHITREDTGYTAETIKTELETHITSTSGVITHSLFLTAQRAGLSDNLTMQLIELYGWDIDFALDIREGDRFYVIYEEKFKDGVKVQDGAILAAEFINQGKSFRAVRYTHADGYSDYYNEEGYSMRKAFLRTPVNFTRISSGFSLGRRHPVLNKIRAHRGVDYAAPSGTPIKATGDGIVTFAGYKGGYGNVVILRHGEKYSTLYGHMSRFAKGISTGKRIKQGQTIGYVGMTGLATGPHLHYEFHVNGVHRNPLTVELPQALGIPGELMADFRAKTTQVLSQLDNVITGKAIQTASQGNRLLR